METAKERKKHFGTLYLSKNKIEIDKANFMECKSIEIGGVTALPSHPLADPQPDKITMRVMELFTNYESKPTTLVEYYKEKMTKAELKSQKLEKMLDFRQALLCLELAELYEEAADSLGSLIAAATSADLKPRKKRMLKLQLQGDSRDYLFNLTPKDSLHFKALIIAINSGKKENLIALRKYLSMLSRETFSKVDYFVHGFLLEANNKSKRAAQCYLSLFHAYQKEENKEKEEACAQKALLLNPTLLAGYTTLSGIPAQKQALLKIAFETQLQLISIEAKVKKPTCYISYAWGTTEKSGEWKKVKQSIKPTPQWIQSHLLEALDMAGAEAYFDVRELKEEDNVMEYMNLSVKTDYVLLVCTPELKDSYNAWLEEESATDIGNEITIIQTRFNDFGKGKGKVLPLIYEGEPTQVNPVPITHNNHWYDFRKEEEFHETCLKLCAKLCGLISRFYIDKYNKKAEEIKEKQTVSQEEKEEIEKWKEERKVRLENFWEPRIKKKEKKKILGPKLK